MSSSLLFNRLRYKHLLLLITLQGSGSVHRAAQNINMSQPAATRMLHEIEAMFGCKLFERLPRGMRPTALGQQLISFAETALIGLERCSEDLASRLEGGYGYLSIGSIMGAAPGLVMDCIAQVKAQYPQLRIRIMGDTSDQVVRLLEQGQIDLAITRRNADTQTPEYEFKALGNESLLLVVRDGHPLLAQDGLQFDELVRDWPWILQPRSSPARIAVDAALQRMNLPQPDDIIECSSVYSMQQLVQLTEAIMVLSETALTDYLRMGLVRALPLSLDEQMEPFGLLLRSGEPPSRESQIFIDLLQAQALKAGNHPAQEGDV